MARTPNYDKFPALPLETHADSLCIGYEAAAAKIREELTDRAGHTLVIDTYPGVDDSELIEALLSRLSPAEWIHTLDLKQPEEEWLPKVQRNLTDDRIFGVLSCRRLEEYFDPDKLKEARTRALQPPTEGLRIVYGVGASLVTPGSLRIYADMARWEIQMRFRAGMGNWGADNGNEDFFRKYKRAYFMDWRAADRHKFSVFDEIDFFLDTNEAGRPKLLAADAVHEGLARLSRRPFRVVPFFDPAPWGGQWMKEVCDLDRSKENYGWCFDCVPEENSLLFDVGGTRFEMPSLNAVYRHPVEILGDRVHARFGCEFPIRFDFLDTIGGGNLSFQIHPLTEYIQQNFGMHYTQDESYYMLEVEEDATVYLGLKTGVDREAMIRDLHAGQASADTPFPADTYVNRFPARKHDHFLIPAGTVHCSGRNSMVLEISATPYIFTFKMWDWGRLGLDGKPRPVHLHHGIPNIQWDRDTEWTETHLVNRIEPLSEGDGWREERTGLHEREFIETRRHWHTGTVSHHTEGGVHVLNLVQGEQAVVESPDGAFDPYIVHYAETFIVPATVGAYTIRPHGPAEGTECATLKAYVRT